MSQKIKFGAGDIYRQLAGQMFKEREDLEFAFRRIFKEHLEDFPPNQSYKEIMNSIDTSGIVEYDRSLGYFVRNPCTNYRKYRAAKVEPNRVDELLLQVANTQKNCEHEMCLAENLMLHESYVLEVYIAGDNHGHKTFQTKCKKCSLQKIERLSQKCPNHLQTMKKGDLEEYSKYFVFENCDFARLGSCPTCNLTVVWGENKPRSD